MQKWEVFLKEFLQGRTKLSEQFEKKRNLARVPVTINGGQEIIFSAGHHNVLQKAIVESFLPIFGKNSTILYVGDTLKKIYILMLSNLKI